MLHEQFRLSTLRALPIFEPLSDDELEHLRPALTVRTCSVGDVVVEEGTPGDELYVLLVGEAKVVRSHRQPHEKIIAVLNPIEVFGEMALLTGELRSASVIATDTCRLLSLTREALEAVLMQHPSVCLTLLRDAYRRMKLMSRAVEPI